MKRFLALVLAIAALPALASPESKATEAPLSRLDEFAQKIIRAHGIPGVGIVAVAGDRVVFVHGYGSADGTHPFTPDTRFYLASNTKAFIGLAMARLIHEGRISLDDPVTKYIPARYFPKDIGADQVKIRDLLAHTTGWANDALISRTAYTGELPADLRSLLRFTEYREDDHSRSFRYSNLGYLIAGMVIEAVTGKSWQQSLSKLVLSPAALLQTTTRAPGSSADAALPFEAGSPTPLDFRKTDATMHAAGGIYSTLTDMGRWLQLFTDSSQERLPSAELQLVNSSLVDGIDKAMGPFKMSGYGYGWIHGNAFGRPLNFHFGSYPGYESMASYMPGSSLGVFVYVNERRGGLRVAGALTVLFYDLMQDSPDLDAHMAMLQKMVDGVYSDPPDSQPAAITQSDLPALCGSYTSGKYGTLNIRAAGNGYTVHLGELHSQARRGENAGQFTVSWIPGQTETFTLSTKDGVAQLAYGDYDSFTQTHQCQAGHKGASNDH